MPPENLPVVSILTPSFNQASFLTDNLRSVACQTYPRVEHIVMDGGSTDDSAVILSDSGSEVTWRSEPDEGQADAVNRAFRESRGEIIGWLNS
ncbi:MAG TPA: glycosyltransferase, partial [Propionibacteriaceae bacterium]